MHAMLLEPVCSVCAVRRYPLIGQSAASSFYGLSKTQLLTLRHVLAHDSVAYGGKDPPHRVFLMENVVKLVNSLGKTAKLTGRLRGAKQTLECKGLTRPDVALLMIKGAQLSVNYGLLHVMCFDPEEDIAEEKRLQGRVTVVVGGSVRQRRRRHEAIVRSA